MNTKKIACLASTALVGSLLAATAAMAQSTASTEVEQVVVTASGTKSVDGLLTAETALKNRSVITQEYIDTQPAGQTIAQTLNLVPGFNFTNSDPYGSSGGTIRLHGQDGAHIGLLVDGVPLNDAGNYAIYTNQQLDPELIEQANVNTGSADVDTATASSTAGIINYTTLRTTKDARFVVKPSVGTDNFRRIFGLVQTGEFGPFGTQAWFAANYTKYDKYKGPGSLEKKQYNFRIYQPIRDNGDFISLTGNWNENRNAQYYSFNIHDATYAVRADEVNTLGWDGDYLTTWVTPTAVNGTADTIPATNSATRGFYGYRINPSNTGTIRGSSRWTIRDNLRATFDPSFNYTLANGGGTFTLSETDLRVVSATGVGKDLNGDGDTRDSVLFYGPSNTNTRRYGFNSSVIWDINDSNLLRVSYAYDEGHTRQTGEFSQLVNGFASDPFSAKDGHEDSTALMVNGHVGQKRDRDSIAVLQQWSAEYRGRFIDDRLRLSVGIRAPLQKRELHQFCYSQAGSSTYTCSDRTPATSVKLATDAVANAVTFGTSTTRYFTPFKAIRKYDAVLPSYGASFKITDSGTIFASYSEQQSSPKVDNLYTLTSTGKLGEVQPETSKGYDFGYRYNKGGIVGSISGWGSTIKDRIVSTRDPTDDTIIDRNVGDVELWGVDAQAGWSIDEALTVYGSASYTNSELQNNLFVGGTAIYPGAGLAAGYAPTKGKELVETPKWMFGGRVTYKVSDFTFGVQGKWVGERWVTDVNDVKVPHYAVWDLDVRYDLNKIGMEKSYVQLNVSNLFDEKYYGDLNGTSTSGLSGAPGYSGPFARRGAPRAAILTLRTEF
ncbi:TonB-dependent receptor [Caulobacter hibisci]|uniref:TonB-dependent receptor n=1 Tax=Caulobacter hibisci TaxID=2035993 RepID=A0ABS0T296_9CAUL|nr:TonB-dependent receptor [Caulobacter hibisci]MBI1685944.1 TonB-dependent receptor [Caulobacter hibisci]